MNPELLRHAITVGSPLAVLSLTIIVVGVAYIRRLKAKEVTLALVPDSQRAKVADEYLSRYKVTAYGASTDQKIELIRTELRYRNLQFGIIITAATLVFLVALSIVTLAYVTTSNSETESQRLKQSMSELGDILQQRRNHAAKILLSHKGELIASLAKVEKYKQQKIEVQTWNSNKIESRLARLTAFTDHFLSAYDSAAQAARDNNPVLVHLYLNDIHRQLVHALNEGFLDSYTVDVIRGSAEGVRPEVVIENKTQPHARNLETELLSPLPPALQSTLPRELRGYDLFRGNESR